MDRQGFDHWLRRYFQAWVSNDRDAVGALFSEEAVYYVNPFLGPRMRGRAEIVDVWTSEPDAQRNIRWSYEPLAVQGDRGIAQWRVSFAPGGRQRGPIDHPEDLGKAAVGLLMRVRLDGIVRMHRFVTVFL